MRVEVGESSVPALSLSPVKWSGDKSTLAKMTSTILCNFGQRALLTISKMRERRRDGAISSGLGGFRRYQSSHRPSLFRALESPDAVGVVGASVAKSK